MLLDAGPIALLDPATTLPAPTAPTLAAFAAAQVRDYAPLEQSLGLAGADFLAAGRAPAGGDGALDLAAAHTELAAQAGQADSSIAGVAAATGVLEGEMAGLRGEVASDLTTPAPNAPRIPPDSTENRPDAPNADHEPPPKEPLA